jgi:O-antigen/teichoic acid export membrane protein
MSRQGADVTAPLPNVEAAAIRSFGFNSFVYIAAMVLQRGAAFLLLPLYTLYLSPADYGILAVVTAINGFLATLFSLAAHSAMVRFYFEYRDQPQVLREFFGTVLTFVALCSVAGCAALLLFGQWLLAPVLGTIPFWPYVALGVVAVVFQPFVTSFLSLVQTQGRALQYAGYSLASFCATVVLTVVFVVFLAWGAIGPLLATLLVSMLFTAVALVAMRGQLTICLRGNYLRQALAYSLPQVPHSLSSQLMATTDRFLLNELLGRASTGLYSVGSMFGLIVDVAGQGLNRAYMPLSMDVLKQPDREGLERLQRSGTWFVAILVLLATFLALFSVELVRILTAPAFGPAAVVVPFIAFAGAMGGAYYVFVAVLFFDTRAVRLLPFATLGGALASVALNLLLAPRYGLVGAGVAAMLAQAVLVIAVAVMARRFESIRWPYRRIAFTYLICFGAVYAALHWLPAGWLAGLVRLAVFLLLVPVVSGCLWGDAWYLPRAALARLAGRKTWLQ